MAGLVPAIRVRRSAIAAMTYKRLGMDARDKRGHDGPSVITRSRSENRNGSRPA